MLLLISNGIPALAQDGGSVSLWASPAVPADVRAAIRQLAQSDRYTLAADAASADVSLDTAPGGEGLRWVYAVVVPFPNIPGAAEWANVQRAWAGDPSAMIDIMPDGSAPPVLVAGANTVETLAVLLGAPTGEPSLQVMPDDGVLAAAWEAPHARWAIVPFHQLQPEWKVLTLDGVDLFDPQADLSSYPLAVTVTFEGDAAQAAQVKDDLALAGGWTGDTNRDPARFTVLVMTGVTAMTRGTAATIEDEGVLFPAQDIAPLLQSADLLHINNEVPFAEDCPEPEYFAGTLTFCSKPAYFDLLTYVGADVIEFSGNHVNDWGPDALTLTLEMYADAGMQVYGGGATLEDAARPLIIEHNGNTIGFLGCNPVGAEKAWATETQGGALRCAYDYADFTQAVTDLSRQVDVTVVTQQYWEIESMYPSAQQVADFERLARAGADIVSGSQQHVAQGFAFEHGAFIHYGLGNLFFDQMHDVNLRRLFIDRQIIYDGRHISTTLFTGMLEDAARPRAMTEAEQRNFLWAIFNASGW